MLSNIVKIWISLISLKFHQLALLLLKDVLKEKPVAHKIEGLSRPCHPIALKRILRIRLFVWQILQVRHYQFVAAIRVCYFHKKPNRQEMSATLRIHVA